MTPRSKRLLLSILALVVLSVAGKLGLTTDFNTQSPSDGLVRVTPYELTVVDGDTLRYAGESVRLIGFDTPEVFSPQCPREKELGDRATELLRALLTAASTIDLAFEANRDRYDRRLARVYINNQDLADLMIEAGLARAYDGGQRLSWCG